MDPDDEGKILFKNSFCDILLMFFHFIRGGYYLVNEITHPTFVICYQIRLSWQYMLLLVVFEDAHFRTDLSVVLHALFFLFSSFVFLPLFFSLLLFLSSFLPPSSILGISSSSPLFSFLSLSSFLCFFPHSDKFFSCTSSCTTTSSSTFLFLAGESVNDSGYSE